MYIPLLLSAWMIDLQGDSIARGNNTLDTPEYAVFKLKHVEEFAQKFPTICTIHDESILPHVSMLATTTIFREFSLLANTRLLELLVCLCSHSKIHIASCIR